MATPLRERRRQMLYDEIIQAAQKLMSEKGHDMMSMDELSALVGISKTTLYSYFATKDELIVAAAVQMMQQLMAVIADEQEGLSPLHRLARLLQTIIQHQVDSETMEPRPWREEMFRFLCEHDESRELLERLDEAVVSQTRAAIAQGEIDPSLALADVVRVFYTLTHTLNVGVFSVGGTPNLKTWPGAVTTMFVRSVSAAHTTRSAQRD